MSQKKNIGGIGRRTRLVVGPLLLVVDAAVVLQPFSRGTLGTVAVLAIGGVPAVTEATQRCPTNTLLGIDTCPIDR